MKWIVNNTTNNSENNDKLSLDLTIIKCIYTQMLWLGFLGALFERVLISVHLKSYFYKLKTLSLLFHFDKKKVLFFILVKTTSVTLIINVTIRYLLYHKTVSRHFWIPLNINLTAQDRTRFSEPFHHSHTGKLNDVITL